MITEEEFKRAQAVIDRYHEERQWEADQELEDDDPINQPEPCPTCGEIDGMVNPCCPDYDPLHYKNCGYG